MGNVGGLVGAFVGRGVVGGAPELTEYSIIPLNTRGENKVPHHSQPAPFPSKNAMSAFELYRAPSPPVPGVYLTPEGKWKV